jgi:hypothetical protein
MMLISSINTAAYEAERRQPSPPNRQQRAGVSLILRAELRPAPQFHSRGLIFKCILHHQPSFWHRNSAISIQLLQIDIHIVVPQSTQSVGVSRPSCHLLRGSVEILRRDGSHAPPALKQSAVVIWHFPLVCDALKDASPVHIQVVPLAISRQYRHS